MKATNKRYHWVCVCVCTHARARQTGKTPKKNPKNQPNFQNTTGKGEHRHEYYICGNITCVKKYFTAIHTDCLILLDEFVAFIFFKTSLIFLRFWMYINRSDHLDHLATNVLQLKMGTATQYTNGIESQTHS